MWLERAADSWWFVWFLVACGIGLVFCACSCLCADNFKAKIGIKACCLGFCCALPCLWIPCGCLIYLTDKSKCNLCEEKLLDRKMSSHRPVCLEDKQSVYQNIEDSPLYACQNSRHEAPPPLKLWPASKIKSPSCYKCDDSIENDGNNFHFCFLCGNGLCSRHHPKETEAEVILDMKEKSTIPEKQFEYMDKTAVTKSIFDTKGEQPVPLYHPVTANQPADQPLPSYPPINSTNKPIQLPSYPPLLNSNISHPIPSYPPIQISSGVHQVPSSPSKSTVVEVPEDDQGTPTAPLLCTTYKTDIVGSNDNINNSKDTYTSSPSYSGTTSNRTYQPPSTYTSPITSQPPSTYTLTTTSQPPSLYDSPGTDSPPKTYTPSASFQSSSTPYTYTSYTPSTNVGSLSTYQPTYTPSSSNLDTYTPTPYSDDLKPASFEIPDDCQPAPPSYEESMKD